MPHEKLHDLALAVLRYDQGLRQFKRECERSDRFSVINGVPDLDELYDEMTDLAREALQSRLLPRS